MTPMTISCIIPAYNEKDRIGVVLRAVRGHPSIHEIIVVDDGSSDGTADAVAEIDGINLIRMSENRGKTFAVTRGLEIASGSHVLLVDADLAGLDPEHLTALIHPVMQHHADIAISLRDNAPRIWRLIGLDYISGERVISRDLLISEIDAMRQLPKFGLEVFMNALCIRQNSRIAVVRWNGVKSPYKNKKYGMINGIKADARMMSDLVKSVTLLGLLRQISAMRRLRIDLHDT